METSSTTGGLAEFIREKPTAAIMIVAGVAVVFVLIGGTGKKSFPNNTPVTIDQSPGTNYVSSETLNAAIAANNEKLLAQLEGNQPPDPAPHPPREGGVEMGGAPMEGEESVAAYIQRNSTWGNP